MNTLYPVFLKLNRLQVLIVGGGYVGYEKLSFLLKSSPDAQVTVVAKEFREELKALARLHDVQLRVGAYETSDLAGKQLVIAGTADAALNRQVHADAKAANLLVNVADTPELCDFYLSGNITKGDIKVAISTNGKSPTLAKRLREFFEDVLPEDLDDLAQHLNDYRKTLKDDFEYKVKALNELTQGLVHKR